MGYIKYGQIRAAEAYGASFPEPAEAVEFVQVVSRSVQPSTQVTGQVVAVRSAELRTEVAGVIREVGFEPGSQVADGALLLALDTRQEQAELAQAQAALALARLDLDRARRLRETGATTVDALDRASVAMRSAAAEVDAVRARIARREIRAPFAGITDLHRFEPGQFLEAGTAVTRLVSSEDRLWVDFSVPAQQAAAVGDTVEVRLSRERAAVPGRILARDAVVDEQSRNLRFRAEVPRAALGALPGALVQVRVTVGESRQAALVPATAVRRDAFGARVFVLTTAEEGAPAPERAQLRNVELGEQLGAELVVLRGLEPGERIAATGAFKLRDGVLVRAVPYLRSEQPL
ncbi:MAG: efflux RND transporter periplasmic adaptor subunit [Pseudomonadota bacterium]